MRGRGGGGCKPGNSNAMIRAPLPTHSPQSRQRRAPRGGGRGGRAGAKGGHIPSGSAAGPRGARAGGCGERARAREAGAEAAPGPASPRQHRSVFTSRVPARLLPPPRSHRAPPARSSLGPAPAAACERASERRGPSARRPPHPRRGGAASPRPAPPRRRPAPSRGRPAPPRGRWAFPGRGVAGRAKGRRAGELRLPLRLLAAAASRFLVPSNLASRLRK